MNPDKEKAIYDYPRAVCRIAALRSAKELLADAIADDLGFDPSDLSELVSLHAAGETDAATLETSSSRASVILGSRLGPHFKWDDPRVMAAWLVCQALGPTPENGPGVLLHALVKRGVAFGSPEFEKAKATFRRHAEDAMLDTL